MRRGSDRSRPEEAKPTPVDRDGPGLLQVALVHVPDLDDPQQPAGREVEHLDPAGLLGALADAEGAALTGVEGRRDQADRLAEVVPARTEWATSVNWNRLTV